MLICLSGASPAEETQPLQDRLGTNWKELSVSAVVFDACMGPIYKGFVLRRANGKVMMYLIKGSSSERIEKPGRTISPETLRLMLARIDELWQEAQASESPMEKLPAKLASITDTADRLIAQLQAAAARAIEMQLSLGRIGTVESNQFDVGAEGGLLKFIADPITDAVTRRK